MSCCCCCCGGQSRYASADGVFERATDLLVCLISSVAANMLTGVFLHLPLLSSCFLWGQSHFVFLVSCFRSSFFFSRAVCFLLSTFLFISGGNASYHCHIIWFHPSGVWCSYLGGCKSSSNQQKYLLEPMLAEFSVRISLSGNCETEKKALQQSS